MNKQRFLNAMKKAGLSPASISNDGTKTQYRFIGKNYYTIAWHYNDKEDLTAYSCEHGDATDSSIDHFPNIYHSTIKSAVCWAAI